jgi:hypothetical protein
VHRDADLSPAAARFVELATSPSHRPSGSPGQER